MKIDKPLSIMLKMREKDSWRKIEVFSFWGMLHNRSFSEFRKRITIYTKDPFCRIVDNIVRF